jgi:hypothetical protein
VGFTAFRLYGSLAGYLAALILLASPMWVLGGHFNALDMGLSAFLNLALCSLLLAQHSFNENRLRAVVIAMRVLFNIRYSFKCFQNHFLTLNHIEPLKILALLEVNPSWQFVHNL